jgi:hypothetical protein
VALTVFSDSIGITADVIAKPKIATPKLFRRELFTIEGFSPMIDPPIIVEDYRGIVSSDPCALVDLNQTRPIK